MLDKCITHVVQASYKQLSFSLYRHVTRHWSVVCYYRFGTTYLSICKGQAVRTRGRPFADGTHMFTRNVSKYQRYVTSQKSKELNYTAGESRLLASKQILLHLTDLKESGVEPFILGLRPLFPVKNKGQHGSSIVSRLQAKE